MNTKTLLTKDAAEDIFFGQIVIIWARWFLIGAVTLLALWSAGTMMEITVTVVVVAALMAINFFVHGRYLIEKPTNQLVLVALSVLDLFIITTLVAVWQRQSGVESPFFVLYYPLVFTFALVFSPRLTIPFALIVVALYVGVCAWMNPNIIFTVSGFSMMFARVSTLATMGGLGTFYWRVQRNRRYKALQHTA